MTSVSLPAVGTAKQPAVRAGRIVLYVVLTVGALLMIVPFVWMLLTAFKSNLEIAKFNWLPQELRWRNFVDAMETAPFLRYFRTACSSRSARQRSRWRSVRRPGTRWRSSRCGAARRC